MPPSSKMYSCKILLDSLSPAGKRLTTMCVTFPRCVLAEFNTHRAFSRNSASSRAIPISRMLKMVQENPFVPMKFGKPEKGMGAKEYWEKDSYEHNRLEGAWHKALMDTVDAVALQSDIGNKEDLNRLLEPFMWHTVIVTATEWANFFKLRTNEGADWKIRTIADMMYDVYYHTSAPLNMPEWGWHMPLMQEGDSELILSYMKQSSENEDGMFQERAKQVSVARCARVSYLTHSGKRDIAKDLELFARLRTSGHWSPFEHVARPIPKPQWLEGNFFGWRQYRKDFQDENTLEFTK